MKRKILILAALTVAACTETTNIIGSIVGNTGIPIATPSPSASPSVSPGPSISPTPSTYPTPCSLPPSVSRGCVAIGDDPRSLHPRVAQVQNLVSPFITTEAAHVAAMVSLLRDAGICAVGGAAAGVASDEVRVKVTNDFDEVYDVWNGQNFRQTLYVKTCSPAGF